tara:strand:- start:45 stop:251 length:207 start_codon:yes stop_codon:yes gene_type:complete
MIGLITLVTLALLVNLYYSKRNSVVTLTFWRALLFGVSYMEGENEETRYAILEVHIAFMVITLIYDID